MQWREIHPAEDAVLTLWPGTLVKESDIDGPQGIHAFFKTAFNIEITPVGCVLTLPDLDRHHEEIPDTGGRCDFFFFVYLSDLPNFALQRFQFGMRWWEDVYFNHNEGIYPIEFREAYPDPSDDFVNK